LRNFALSAMIATWAWTYTTLKNQLSVGLHSEFSSEMTFEKFYELSYDGDTRVRHVTLSLSVSLSRLLPLSIPLSPFLSLSVPLSSPAQL